MRKEDQNTKVGRYDLKVDVYGFAIIMWELAMWEQDNLNKWSYETRDTSF